VKRTGGAAQAVAAQTSGSSEVHRIQVQFNPRDISGPPSATELSARIVRRRRISFNRVLLVGVEASADLRRAVIPKIG
jgi:hypothetical protein